MVILGGYWWGTGIALPGTLPVPHPGYTPPLPTWLPVRRAGPDMQPDSAVGLKSVAQLTLSLYISGFQGITEVYNLATVGNPNDHKCIPGNKKAGVSNPWTGPLICQQWSIKL